MNRKEDQLNDFFAAFQKNLHDMGRVRLAYERTEEQHIEQNGKRFYKNYATFCVCKSQRNRKTNINTNH